MLCESILLNTEEQDGAFLVNRMEKRENESKLYADEMCIKCVMWCVLFWMSVVSSSLCCSDCSQAALCQMSYPVTLLKPSKFSWWIGSRPGNEQAFLCQGGNRFSLVYTSIFALNSQNCYCILCHRGIIHCELWLPVFANCCLHIFRLSKKLERMVLRHDTDSQSETDSESASSREHVEVRFKPVEYTQDPVRSKEKVSLLNDQPLI